MKKGGFMKKLIVLSLIVCFMYVWCNAYAETLGPFRDAKGKVLSAFDYEDITVATTAIGLTSTEYDIDTVKPTVRMVACYNDAQPIRVRLDGSDPTSSVGTQMNDKDIIIIEDYDDITDFRAIRQGGTSSTLRCTYFR